MSVASVTAAEGALIAHLRSMPKWLRDQTILLLSDCAAPSGVRPDQTLIDLLQKALAHE